MNLMVFLGAGVSTPSEVPDGRQITESLLGDEWWRDSVQCFRRGSHPNPILGDEPYIKELQAFLRYLKRHIDDYLKERQGGREGNYEDIFYLVLQLLGEENKVGNPAVRSFGREKQRWIQRLLRTRKRREPISPSRFLDDAVDLTIGVVCHHLGRSRRCQITGLRLLEEILGAKSFETVDIATLNHDLLLDRLLAETNASDFTDGFDPVPRGDLRHFNAANYDLPKRVRLLKLHGSINWFKYPFQRGTHRTTECCIDVSNGGRDPLDENGGLVHGSYRPVILCGTDNKTQEYPFGVFSELQHTFQRMLNKTQVVVMSGYGWNDRGINNRFFDWLAADSNRTVFLLHKDPEGEVRQRSNSRMWHLYDDYRRRNQLVPVRKWFCEATLENLLHRIEVAARTREFPGLPQIVESVVLDIFDRDPESSELCLGGLGTEAIREIIERIFILLDVFASPQEYQFAEMAYCKVDRSAIAADILGLMPEHLRRVLDGGGEGPLQNVKVLSHAVDSALLALLKKCRHRGTKREFLELLADLCRRAEVRSCAQGSPLAPGETTST